MKIIRERKIKMNNNETVVAKGVYQNADSSFSWITFTRSGTCKKVETAMKKAGF